MLNIFLLTIEILPIVNNLTNILPGLFNKITSINQQLMPIGNISENLNRIRELIQHARDAANKVLLVFSPCCCVCHLKLHVYPRTLLCHYAQVCFMFGESIGKKNVSRAEWQLPPKVNVVKLSLLCGAEVAGAT